MEKSLTEVRSKTDLEDSWSVLPHQERLEAFGALARDEAEELFFDLGAQDQAEILLGISATERRSWIRLLEPDDVADLIQETATEEQEPLLNLLDTSTRNEVRALLAYSEDVAGGLMNPHYARLRPDMTVGEAISYLQKQSREQAELISYAYVLDSDQHLLGMVSFRDLCAGHAPQKVQDIMVTDLITVLEHTDQEEISRLFAERDLMAVPVIDDAGRMKGIVTINDIVDVVDEEATEDIQKLGGSEALGAPYLRVGIWSMTKKRAGWLMILFLSEMLTATAMGYFEKEIARAVVLALFVPLIISSGGNAGSQASTIVIRAMALQEVQLKDWWLVAGREVVLGILLGCILGVIGFARIVLWQGWFASYGAHYLLVAVTILFSLVGVVTWGTVVGAVLPFILKYFNQDPATASTPFVATLVDVTGLIIYFTTASIIMQGTLL